MRIGRILLLAAALALTAGTAAASTTYFRLPISHRAVSKPKRIEFADATFTRLHWRGWNRRHAHGTGRARVNDCTPSCATGHIIHGRLTVTMYHRHKVGDRWFYRCLKARVRGFPHQLRWCNQD
jgi:hypothetical protein